MLDELLAAKKITYEQAETYQLFECSTLGKKWLQKKMYETFMEEPPKEYINGELLGLIDGRRSIIREVLSEIEHINNVIREYQNERPKQSEQWW